MLYACLFWGYMHKFGEMSASWSVRVCIVLVLNQGVLNRVKIKFADIFLKKNKIDLYVTLID